MSQIFDGAEYLASAQTIAVEAGEVILPYYHAQKSLDTRTKSDDTPLTAADIAANDLIVSRLTALTPHWPVLSEEDQAPDFSVRQNWGPYWLVDPLDGTRGFVQGGDQFTVNIALIVDHQPVMGVIYWPTRMQLTWAMRSAGAWQRTGADGDIIPLRVTVPHQSPLRVLSGLSAKQPRVKRWCREHQYVITQVNSSLKLVMLAAGEGDCYPRFGPTCEWDLAAGQCILQEAGGLLVDLDAQPLQYNRKSSLINGAFCAMGDPRLQSFVIEELRGVENEYKPTD